MLLTASASLIPVWHLIGASLTTGYRRSYGEGLEGSFFLQVSMPVHILAFCGCVCAPLLMAHPLKRKVKFMGLAALVFIIDLIATSTLIDFGMFVD
jgi:hypothetical protein